VELAQRYFGSLIKDFPDSRFSADAFYALGLTAYKLGDYEGAKLYYTKSLELAEVKDVANIRFNLAEALEANSEFDAAAKQYLLAADLYARSPRSLARALLRAAKLYEDKESFKQALEIYKRIIEQGGQEAKFAQERVEWINAAVLRK
jgi:tetratricopeptide (TPR) repeat protein